mmetsp:Transcript_37714/g.121316  ORF Transcript_37714/g.121316 Transcript_37714/m.121316 type:complete len:268 (-) Transcript_37714:17-820(-)
MHAADGGRTQRVAPCKPEPKFGWRPRAAIPKSCSVVLLAAAPLLRNGEVLVEDVHGDVHQVLLLHGAHLREQVGALDRRVRLRDVLEAVVGHGRVQEVDDALDGGARGQSALELLHAQADVLVRAVAAADVADGAGVVEEALGTHELLLGQGCGLALAVHGDQRVLEVRLRGARAGDEQHGAEGGARDEAAEGGPHRLLQGLGGGRRRGPAQRRALGGRGARGVGAGGRHEACTETEQADRRQCARGLGPGHRCFGPGEVEQGAARV